jgi:hypothetical protein
VNTRHSRCLRVCTLSPWLPREAPAQPQWLRACEADEKRACRPGCDGKRVVWGSIKESTLPLDQCAHEQIRLIHSHTSTSSHLKCCFAIAHPSLRVFRLRSPLRHTVCTQIHEQIKVYFVRLSFYISGFLPHAVEADLEQHARERTFNSWTHVCPRHSAALPCSHVRVQVRLAGRWPTHPQEDFSLADIS